MTTAQMPEAREILLQHQHQLGLRRCVGSSNLAAGLKSVAKHERSLFPSCLAAAGPEIQSAKYWESG